MDLTCKECSGTVEKQGSQFKCNKCGRIIVFKSQKKKKQGK